jgi:hypothetical protein
MEWLAFNLTYLTLDIVGHYQQNSSNLWIGWAFSLTLPNPECGQWQTAELHQPIAWLGV